MGDSSAVWRNHVMLQAALSFSDMWREAGSSGEAAVAAAGEGSSGAAVGKQWGRLWVAAVGKVMGPCPCRVVPRGISPPLTS